MFYEESEINKVFSCPCCDLKFEDSKVLPCGNIICGYCASRLNKKFQCELCFKTHVVPDEGFPISNLILKFLSIKSDEVIRSSQATNLKNNLKEIQLIIKRLSFKINNGVDYIKEHCINLRNDVQLATERFIKDVNDLSETMINKINKYEQKRIRDYKDLATDKQEHLKVVNELQIFYDRWNDYLKQFKINDYEIHYANLAAQLISLNSNKTNVLLDKLNFSGIYLNYENKSREINKNILGHLFKTREQKLDIDSFEEASIKNIFPKSDFNIDRAVSDEFLISYSNEFGNFVLKKIDQDGTVINTFKNYQIYNYNRKYAILLYFKSYDNFVIVSMLTQIGPYLKILGTDLKEKFSIETDHTYSVIAGNDSNIFCLIPELNKNNLNIYDSKLQLIKTIGNDSLFLPHKFYFPRDLIQLENKCKKYFVLRKSELGIIDQESGLLLSRITFSISFSANKFYIGLDDNIILISYENKAIHYYDFDGRRSKMIELCNTPNKFISFVDFEDEICFYDEENEEILY